MRIRAARPDDAEAIRALLTRCFPGDEEARLTEALAAGGHVALALLAEDRPPVGYALFSRMVEPAGTLALGPVATLEDQRRRGIASALIRDGLERARAEGWRGVFVLGDPAFYQRFGFSAEVAKAWDSPYAGPYFMALELIPGALSGNGAAVYAAPFANS